MSDNYGGTTTSDTARLSLFQDLATWLNNHSNVAAAIKWQFQPGDLYNYYAPPAESDKVAWMNWNATQQSELNQAYLDVVAWFNAGASQVTMVPGGTSNTLTDEPTNLYSQVSNDAGPTMVTVSPAYLWRLYRAHVAFSLMLECSHQLPWTVTTYDSHSLRYLFDSATMAFMLPSGEFGLGTYGGANLPTLRDNNRPRTTFADPRWTYPWLKQAGLIGGNRLGTIGGLLDWMRQNMTHFFGNDVFANDQAIWGYRGFSPISKIVGGTVDGNNPSYGTQHWTAGCHGSTGFLHAALRVVNLPVQPIWTCGHELVYFVSEDLYLDHADDPYNAVVRGSSASSLLLLLDSSTWTSRFGSDTAVNFLDGASSVCPWIGYAAVHFPP